MEMFEIQSTREADVYQQPHHTNFTVIVKGLRVVPHLIWLTLTIRSSCTCTLIQPFIQVVNGKDNCASTNSDLDESGSIRVNKLVLVECSSSLILIVDITTESLI